MSRPPRPGRRLGLAGGLAAALLAPATGCRSGSHEEAQRVLHAIDALRDSPADALETREKRIEELSGLPVKGEPADRAREACAKAYRLLVQGKKLEAHIREELGKPADPGVDAGADPSERLVADLIEAETDIKASAAVMPDCDRGVARLHDELRR